MYSLVKHVIDVSATPVYSLYLILCWIQGYHATVFAYGQTGSGKTFTMEGYKYSVVTAGKPPQANFDAGDNEGLVPRSVRLLFDMIK